MARRVRSRRTARAVRASASEAACADRPRRTERRAAAPRAARAARAPGRACARRASASPAAETSCTPTAGGLFHRVRQPGEVIAERYEIEEKLAVGGMGAVYRARHLVSRKPVALK